MFRPAGACSGGTPDWSAPDWSAAAMHLCPFLCGFLPCAAARVSVMLPRALLVGLDAACRMCWLLLSSCVLRCRVCAQVLNSSVSNCSAPRIPCHAPTTTIEMRHTDRSGSGGRCMTMNRPLSACVAVTVAAVFQLFKRAISIRSRVVRLTRDNASFIHRFSR